ncbi:helix-turn-helix domain-containing protein [Nocardia transvalensis]|uniref:helix-turn-helix domain-containing protein n=1 Tax=Nocardia transvalensis TaxID=37333 RepID=UPI001894E68E|nr:helix-turn-helix transcriptional regulator [Nocardia transvalensis]MBF6332525.1 helix-turn-helix transcriptional regulator [Nocardia transvalensis]
MTRAIHEAREALGARLRELRRDAGLTGRKLAELAGWHESKTSKIEYGKQTPSEADLRIWCRHTESLDQLPDLIASLRNIEAAYMEFRRVLGTGTRRRQRMLVKTEGETKLIRWYEPYVVPGLLQTPEYIEWILAKVIGFYGVPNDLDEGVAARIERQKVLYQGDHRFSFLIAEQVLRTTAKDDSVMVGQLDRLLTVMSLPRVLLGVVPERATYEAPAINGFVVYDNRLVDVETVSAELSITQPREIALYERMFAVLTEQAVHGEAARNLIKAELDRRRRRGRD